MKGADVRRTGKYVLVILLGVLSTAYAADDKKPDSVVLGWQKSLAVDFTTTQTAYSDSWVGGEAGSVNWVSNLNGMVSNQLKPWFNYRATLKLSFGQTLTQDADTKKWSKPMKSTDLIDFENVGLFTLDKYVDPYIAFRLESQFYDAQNPHKKLYLSPLKLTESGGIARKFYTNGDQLVMTRLGFGIRQIITSMIVDTATLATTHSTATDGGIESVTDASLKLRSNLLYTGKLTLYKALYYSKKNEVKGTPFADDWKAIDVNWENIVTASITRIIAVNLYTQFLYDKQVSHRGRIKETVAIGFVYKMF
jgi:hypothetical protein